MTTTDYDDNDHDHHHHHHHYHNYYYYYYYYDEDDDDYYDYDLCPLTKLKDGLHSLHQADYDAIQWPNNAKTTTLDQQDEF